MGRVGVAMPERRRTGFPTLEGVRLRLKDDERESDPDERGIGVGELNVCPVGAMSSR